MKIGSLFSGVAGLDRAVEAVTGATPAWFVEFDAAPSKVLERHYPGVPNYGDVTNGLDGLPVASERALLPTPRATDGTKGGPNQRGSSGDLMLPSAVQPANLLPTPTRRDHKGRNQRGDDTCLPGAVADYGQYAPAIARWEAIVGEAAPPPTIEGRNGPRLNPDLPRWMMGFPAGWLDGLTPSQQLKAAGNAVCQQQAESALRILLGDS